MPSDESCHRGASLLNQLANAVPRSTLVTMAQDARWADRVTKNLSGPAGYFPPATKCRQGLNAPAWPTFCSRASFQVLLVWVHDRTQSPPW